MLKTDLSVLLGLPESENEQRPQSRRMVKLTFFVFLNEPFDVGAVKIRRLARRFVEKYLLKRPVKLPSKPRVQRNAEACLWTRVDFVGEQVAARFAQDIFSNASFEFVFERNPSTRYRLSSKYRTEGT